MSCSVGIWRKFFFMAFSSRLKTVFSVRLERASQWT